jgi:hypothetical protein
MSTPIERAVADWHRFLAGEYPGGLDELLHDDVVFYSPVVFAPQHGKDLTKMYLRGAGATFGGSADTPVDASTDGGFHYLKEVLSGSHAVLEFEVVVDGIVMNGVDIITVDDDGKITEFKVMMRPMKAIELMRQKMADVLASLQDTGAAPQPK